jgi:hypothetical protein
MKIDRSLAKVVPAGKCNARHTVAREQGPKHNDRGTHFLHELIGCDPVTMLRGHDRELVSAHSFDRCTDRLKNIAHDRDVHNVWNVLESSRSFGQQGRGHEF